MPARAATARRSALSLVPGKRATANVLSPAFMDSFLCWTRGDGGIDTPTQDQAGSREEMALSFTHVRAAPKNKSCCGSNHVNHVE